MVSPLSATRRPRHRLRHLEISQRSFLQWLMPQLSILDGDRGKSNVIVECDQCYFDRNALCDVTLHNLRTAGNQLRGCGHYARRQQSHSFGDMNMDCVYRQPHRIQRRRCVSIQGGWWSPRAGMGSVGSVVSGSNRIPHRITTVSVI